MLRMKIYECLFTKVEFEKNVAWDKLFSCTYVQSMNSEYK